MLKKKKEQKKFQLVNGLVVLRGNLRRRSIRRGKEGEREAICQPGETARISRRKIAGELDECFKVLKDRRGGG